MLVIFTNVYLCACSSKLMTLNEEDLFHEKNNPGHFCGA